MCEIDLHGVYFHWYYKPKVTLKSCIKSYKNFKCLAQILKNHERSCRDLTDRSCQDLTGDLAQILHDLTKFPERDLKLHLLISVPSLYIDSGWSQELTLCTWVSSRSSNIFSNKLPCHLDKTSHNFGKIFQDEIIMRNANTGIKGDVTQLYPISCVCFNLMIPNKRITGGTGGL